MQTAMLAPVIRFHIHVGVRLALRSLMPLVLALVVGLGMGSNPSDTLVAAGAAISGPGSSARSIAAIVMIAAGLALWARTRITQGLTGWVRHLPASAAAHRRGAALALVAAQGPWLVLVAMLLIVGGISGPRHGEWTLRLPGVLLLAIGSAYAALPLQRRIVSVPSGLAASALGMLGTWTGLLAAAGCIALADLAGGRLNLRKRARRFPSLARITLPLAISWRALQWRFAAALLPGLAAWAACSLMIANNSLGPRNRFMVVTLAGGAAVTLVTAALAGDLERRRPPWAWVRTLPWSSSHRVLLESILLGSPCVVLASLFAFLDARAGLTVLAVTPWLVARAAGRLAGDPAGALGPGGAVLLEGFIGFGLSALVAWVAPLLLAAAPFALRTAAARDRRQPVSRRAESAAWSGT